MRNSGSYKWCLGARWIVPFCHMFLSPSRLWTLWRQRPWLVHFWALECKRGQDTWKAELTLAKETQSLVATWNRSRIYLLKTWRKEHRQRALELSTFSDNLRSRHVWWLRGYERSEATGWNEVAKRVEMVGVLKRKIATATNCKQSLRPHGLCSPWNSPGQNTGVGSLSLLQGIFPAQGSNPGLLHCRRILHQLSHWGSP